MSPEQEIAIDLTEDERSLLYQGLAQWGGPAKGTEPMAVAMGFSGVSNLYSVGYRIAGDIRAELPLTIADWRRAVLATEVMFASDIVGAGLEWQGITGWDDLTTLHLIRSVQRKILHATAPILRGE
ncbi:hypothetical protein CVV68_01405 [Arthrobacter livingstonensis]|uniref:Uncharacterized protein n=1 Tax=Arthrobacter livingstonensis TaxID=670078 RepID=A0A2V5LHU6_9MICC|nr:hypothetical protein [Arthrobacter livingstonensis]PYI69793.1 hypothetical protein CVV68_01405 [Arthrobacter livingstonensis]